MFKSNGYQESEYEHHNILPLHNYSVAKVKPTYSVRMQSWQESCDVPHFGQKSGGSLYWYNVLSYLTVSLQGTYPREMKIHIQTKSGSQLFTVLYS